MLQNSVQISQNFLQLLNFDELKLIRGKEEVSWIKLCFLGTTFDFWSTPKPKSSWEN